MFGLGCLRFSSAAWLSQGMPAWCLIELQYCVIDANHHQDNKCSGVMALWVQGIETLCAAAGARWL